MRPNIFPRSGTPVGGLTQALGLVSQVAHEAAVNSRVEVSGPLQGNFSTFSGSRVTGEFPTKLECFEIRGCWEQENPVPKAGPSRGKFWVCDAVPVQYWQDADPLETFYSATGNLKVPGGVDSGSTINSVGSTNDPNYITPTRIFWPICGNGDSSDSSNTSNASSTPIDTNSVSQISSGECGTEPDECNPCDSQQYLPPLHGIGQWVWCILDYPANIWHVMHNYDELIQFQLCEDMVGCASAKAKVISFPCETCAGSSASSQPSSNQSGSQPSSSNPNSSSQPSSEAPSSQPPSSQPPSSQESHSSHQPPSSSVGPPSHSEGPPSHSEGPPPPPPPTRTCTLVSKVRCIEGGSHGCTTYVKSVSFDSTTCKLTVETGTIGFEVEYCTIHLAPGSYCECGDTFESISNIIESTPASEQSQSTSHPPHSSSQPSSEAPSSTESSSNLSSNSSSNSNSSQSCDETCLKDSLTRGTIRVHDPLGIVNVAFPNGIATSGVSGWCKWAPESRRFHVVSYGQSNCATSNPFYGTTL